MWQVTLVLIYLSDSTIVLKMRHALCDTPFTYTFVSVRHDIMMIFEGREYTRMDVLSFFVAMQRVPILVLFLSVLDNYMISGESAYSYLFCLGLLFCLLN